MGIYPVGLIVMFLSKNHQRCGDYAAGTVVIVERRRPVPRSRTRLRPPNDLKFPEIELHINRLTVEQYRVLKSFLDRKEFLDEGHRMQLARLLAGQILKQWKMSAGSSFSEERFVEEIVMLYEQRKRAL